MQAGLTLILAQTHGSLLDRLLGFRRLSWSEPEAEFGWSWALPAWCWTMVIVGSCIFAAWSYSRMVGSRPLRGLVAAVRASLIILLASLLAGPVMVLREEMVEPDSLLVLVDRSASMQFKDAVQAETNKPLSRDATLKAALLSQAEVFDNEEGLGAGRRIAWLGFGAQTFPIEPPLSEGAWPAAAQPATAIRTAIEQALERASGRPISGVVLFSDGRSPQVTGSDFSRRLRREGVSVFAVPIGAKQLPLDLSIGQVRAPQKAFANDMIPVSVTVERIGGHEVDLDSVRVRLVDTADDQVLDERTLAGSGFGQVVRLAGRSSQVGKVAWRIEVRHEPPEEKAVQRELLTTNNIEQLVVELIDRPIRTLYIEGYPRWEYRYLKNLLIREKSITASTLLVSADRAFAQEGNLPITRPPTDAQEMSGFDVVILGDVPPAYLTGAKLALLRDHVAIEGAGLLWIGGEQFTPRAYASTPLRDLLPMRDPAAVERNVDRGAPVEMWPTSTANALSVLRLRGPDSGAAQWPAGLPQLQWVQALGALKPTAEVLAIASAAGAGEVPEALGLPLVVRLRYGSGQSLYVATDETWRWRYGRGELYFEQFWIQLIRLLGRSRVQQTGDRAWMTVSQRRVEAGHPVVVELVIQDPSLLDRELTKVAVTVRDGREVTAPIVDELELGPQFGPEGLVETSRQIYRAVWRPPAGGAAMLRFRVSEPALVDLDIWREIEVLAPDDEVRHVEPDHDRLTALAEQTGGRVVDLDRLADLHQWVPNRARKTPNDTREALWDSPLAFIVVVGLLTAEWILRKVLRLP